MIGERVHVSFTYSGAHSLQLVLDQLGNRERVIRLDDTLDDGPIAPYACTARADWQGRDTAADLARFWDEATTANEHVAWFSRRCAREYCAYLEWISRCATPPLVVRKPHRA